MPDAIEELTSHLKSFRSAPFLFVGSGLSRRYLDLPDWEGLLRELAALTSRPFGYFVTAGDGEPTEIASAIAEELRSSWWDEPKFATSRRLYGDLLSSRDGPLKAEVARVVTDALSRRNADSVHEAELKALSKSVVDGVITTNYDGLLESVFNDYQVFVGQDELLFTDPQGIGEIYKIHGDASSPESIVLTRRDFSQFNARNPYLAAKLLTIFVERPVIFLGYSLKDPDVTQILVSIATVLTNENLRKLEGNLVLVEWDPDLRAPTLAPGLVSASGYSIPVRVLRVASFLQLFEALGTLEHKFSAPVLRRLKSHVYELVRTNDPQARLFVSDLDKIDNDVDVVIGVGMESRLSDQGYRGIQRIDLLLDVLEERSQYNAKQIVEVVLPELLRQTGITPEYRYLREAGLLTKDGALRVGAAVDSKIATKVALGGSPFQVPQSTRRRATQLALASGSLRQLDRDLGTTQALACAPALPHDVLDLGELRTYLVEHKDAFTGAPGDRANWTRLVGLYDYLKFGRLR